MPNDRVQNGKIIQTDELAIGYDTDLIRGITLEIEAGRIVTLIGPNGSGKSTLLKTLSGQLDVRGGCVYLDGRDISGMNVLDKAKSMSMVMTVSVRPRMMTCREVIGMGRYPYTGRFGRLGVEDLKEIDHAVELTGTLEILDRPFDRISDGQRQRVMLARAIAQKPKVMILDEPTSFLDIRYRLDILNTIRTIADKENVAIVMSLHELEPAMRISDKVVAIGEGKILRTGTPREVFEESFIRRLYGIEDRDLRLLGPGPWITDETVSEMMTAVNEESPASTGEIPAADRELTAVSGEASAADWESPAVTRETAVTISKRTGEEPLDRRRAKAIMIQGTMSGAGKSLITAGLCWIFARDGYSVAPFKSQNMANNSYVTHDGLEMGRAQVMQARCCNREPLSIMNPILLKPTDNVGSQVIVNGKSVGNMRAAEYYKFKTELIPEIRSAYDNLSEMADVIVIEGAGSPVELNLKENDIVNMGIAKMTDAAVLLVGDIDRGGVFAQLKGTLDLLEADEREKVKGIIVNKFRGDRSLFDDGVRILEEKTGKPVIGVVPYLDVRLEDEDSLSGRFDRRSPGAFDICVIRFPRISNYTDMDVFEQSPDISVRYIDDPADVGDPDVIILPGSKNTIADLKWMRECGLDRTVTGFARAGKVVIGICGGYQMLGARIEDPEGVESGATAKGLELLPVRTVMSGDKTRREYKGHIHELTGVLGRLSGMAITGYEIHNGITTFMKEAVEAATTGATGEIGARKHIRMSFAEDGSGCSMGNVYGTYIHGIFDEEGVAPCLVRLVADRAGKDVDVSMMRTNNDVSMEMYDRLADGLRESLDMNAIYKMIGIV